MSYPTVTASYRLRQPKKLSLFRRLFLKWSEEAWEYSRYHGTNNSPVQPGQPEISEFAPLSFAGKSCISFNVYAANGGFVIQHNKLERFKENDLPTLTIVPSGENLGEAVDHILTVEALKS